MKTTKLLVIFGSLLLLGVFKLTFSPAVQGQTGSVTSPTGVTASNGSYTTKIGINWDTVRNATTYRIFRNTTNNPATAASIGTTAAPFFFDANAQQNATFFYWVRAENGAVVSEMSSSATGLRANGTPNGPVPPLGPPPAPNGNPITATKTYLGKVLFWDEQLSSTKTVSCGTCHINSASGSDPRSIITDPNATNPGVDGIFGTADDITGSPGVPLSNSVGLYQWSIAAGIRPQVTTRRSMPAINAGYIPELFWDGRAGAVFRDPITNAIILNGGAALETQAAGPPLSDVEMAHTGRDWGGTALQLQNSKPLALSSAIPAPLQAWIGGRTYPELFLEAFGTNEVTPARIALAIATYERTLFSDRTPFDLFTGGATNPLTAAELRGRTVYNQSNCNACHGGELLTNDAFLYTGVRPVNDDLGRFTVTGQIRDRGQMKVPGLRNLELRPPYMRNGRFATIEAVIDFYNRGGDFDAPNKAPGIVPLGLNAQERADLAAFLRRPLTDPRVTTETGPFSRPTLFTESNRVPTVSGTGRSGTGGNVPQVSAIEPPLVGNNSFTVGVSNSLANANAVLVVNSTDPGVGTTVPVAGSFARQTVTLSNTGNGSGYGSVSLAIPDNPALVGQTFFGRWYITDAGATNGFSVSRVFQFTVFGEATPSVPTRTRFDFDGDARADVSIFRPGAGEWWYLRSSDGTNRAFQFGTASDKVIPADYTGDGKTDVAFWRESTGEWFVLRSEDDSFYSFPFGTAGDIPVPGDFDGDGKFDPAIFRPSSATWFIVKSTGGTTIQTFGANGDKPVPADYDGDGKADLAIYRPADGSWWLNRSTSGLIVYNFGTATDMTVPGDYTGDGKTDVAFWRPSNGEWFILRSEDVSYFSFPFGANGDVPAAADYDGDGRYDPTVFRPAGANWFSLQSTSGTVITQFGAAGDIPVPSGR